MGKPWENAGFSMGLDGLGMGPSGFIKHGWLENSLTECRFLDKKILDKWSIFQPAMFDYRRVEVRHIAMFDSDSTIRFFLGVATVSTQESGSHLENVPPKSPQSKAQGRNQTCFGVRWVHP